MYLGGITIEHADWKKKLCNKVRSGHAHITCYLISTHTSAHWPHMLAKCVLLLHRPFHRLTSPRSLHQDVFPSDVFVNAGKKLLQPPSSPKYKTLFRESELEHGQAVVRPGFRVVVISSLDPYDFEQQLEQSIPLGYMQPLYIATE